MWDSAVESIGLAMKLKSLEDIPAYELPEHYGCRFYQPGDELHWAQMWTSAGGFPSAEKALETFRRDFEKSETLNQRMIFFTDRGIPFATATVWYNDDPEVGRLHWVCVDEAHQNQGLSKVLISKVLEHCRTLGYHSANLLTMTHCWVAIRMYHRFGFAADVRDDKERRGWEMISEKSGIDFLKDVE